MTEAEEDPREFLRNASFSPTAIRTRFPNAERILTEGVFLSHSGLDSERIEEDIVLAVLHERFGDGIFFHNRGSGGANGYKELVQAALYFCDKFLVAISRFSLNNLWVRAEVDWALEHQRPMVCCLLDDSEPCSLDPRLSPTSAPTGTPVVDFRFDAAAAQDCLAGIIDDLLQKFPYRRLV